ncbi:MAG: signal peptidase I [Thaumarchaeota archaeon]|nr:signal peptidase I [Nitrososphaerota archaeon]
MRLPKGLPKRLGISLLIALFAAAILLPISMGTLTYPMTVVNGNSMYPALQNGDLVVFHSAPQGEIPNGTVIVFVQSGTGISALDSLLKPVLIHRIVGTVIQSDRTINYETKGDNNQQPDPGLVPSARILGTPEVVIPKVGLVVMFAQSPQGLVTIVGLITFAYIGGSEAKAKKDEEKGAFLGALAQMSLNGELPDGVFKKFELAVNYIQDLNPDQITDGRVLALVDWIKKGGLDAGWKVNRTLCPVCSTTATNFECSNGLLLTVCPSCVSGLPR